MFTVRHGGSDWLDRMAQDARIMGEARMLRDEDNFTPEVRDTVIKRLQEYLERTAKSQATAARSMGLSGSTLSQLISGNYPADVEAHIRSIDKWLEQQILRENAPKPPGFVKTSTATEIYKICRWIQKIGAIGVIYGPAGIGKTMTAQALRAETPGSVYMRVPAACQSRLAVLETLAQSLRMGGIKVTAFTIYGALVDVLKDTGRLIIVDEAHRLVERRKDEGLHCLRDLHDETGCPMLWFGMATLAEYIQTGKTRYEALDQLARRIKWWGDLQTVAMRTDGGPGLHSVDDIRKMLAASKIRVTPDAELYLTAIANEPRQGALGEAHTLATIAATFAGDKPITAAMLRDIRRQRLGNRAYEQIERQMELRTAAAG